MLGYHVGRCAIRTSYDDSGIVSETSVLCALSTATMAAVRRVLCVSCRYSHGMTSGVSPLLPLDEYIASLARKRMAAGALFRDEDGRVLLVDPMYKPTWDLPGGAVEKEESPYAACRREVDEELGLDRPPGRVLVVDWVPSRPERPEGLIVVYDGGVLASGEVAAITLPDGELAGYEFVKPGEVAERVSPLLARRIAACVDALVAGTVISLEDGCPVT